jgi:pyruvate dehydrogenase E2 component (dihydrolipoyllysine-residue acetyltransferase)
MSNIDIHVPDLGTDGEVEVIEVLVSVGDPIALDDPIVVLESDKASIEVPATAAGVISALHVSVGQKIKQDDLILTLNAEDSQASNAEVSTETPTQVPEGESQSAKSEFDEGAAVKPETEEASVAAEETIVVPDMGGVAEAEVIEVLVSLGDDVDLDQGLIVLESDKASMDIPSPVAGKLVKLNIAVGDKLAEGDQIAVVATTHSGQAIERKHKEPDPQPAVLETKTKPQPSSTRTASEFEATTEVSVHAGPAVRKLGRELGVDLARVKATGPKGRIQKDDLNLYIKDQIQKAQSGAHIGVGIKQPALPDFSQFGEIEMRKLERIQRLTAENMQSSWNNIPHVTQFDEADITALEEFRKSKRGDAEAKGLKLSPLPFLIRACAQVLVDLPQFNVSLDLANQQMIHKKYIHIGVAVDTSYGLVVPVIRDVMQKSIWQIAGELIELADKAKSRKLSPAEMQGACFTISSLGSIGGTAFTPIVNQPEVAILGVSKAQYKPVYINDKFEPRLMLPLSLSYDHRAVNGADGARFTAALATYLSDIRELLF